MFVCLDFLLLGYWLVCLLQKVFKVSTQKSFAESIFRTSQAQNITHAPYCLTDRLSLLKTMSLCLFVCLSVCLCLSVSVSVSISLSPSPSLSLSRNEFKRPLCIGYIDYEKAFDSIEHKTIFKALRSIGINETYITILEDTYTGDTTRVYMDSQVSEEIPILRGVRQGDPIPPNYSQQQFRRCLKMPN